MAFKLQFLGATERVTGSMYLLRAGEHTVLLECGLVQGSSDEEAHNRAPFPMRIDEIDAVILSHAHIDHSGRVPLLFKRGYQGPIYVQDATRALCQIMLPDSGYLNEKDAEWENKKRRKLTSRVEPLYTRADAEDCLPLFRGAKYEQDIELAPGLVLRFHDAGHILGSAIVELSYLDNGNKRTLVFSGDLGFRDAPVMNPPKLMRHADVVLMESTYGDRLHRSIADTIEEMGQLFETARANKGNILIPAFTVGRTQDLLYLMEKHYEAWNLHNWQIYLDSPMGVDATRTYAHYRHLYGAKLFEPGSDHPRLPNFHSARSTEDSIALNEIRSGAIIIAGSGMCSGGRIHHHLKNNIDRPNCHLVFVGFQAHGTLGRRIVDGAKYVRLFGEEHAVKIQVHTIGGLSAHADQADLINWYAGFENKPPVYLVHGEPESQAPLAAKLAAQSGATVSIAKYGQEIDI
jgi:metallo-beta-lactamase family protein